MQRTETLHKSDTLSKTGCVYRYYKMKREKIGVIVDHKWFQDIIPLS
jgi:hypothetical protein